MDIVTCLFYIPLHISGHITVTNSFKYYGDPGTLAHHTTDNYDQVSNIRSHNKNEDKTEKV